MSESEPSDPPVVEVARPEAETPAPVAVAVRAEVARVTDEIADLTAIRTDMREIRLMIESNDSRLQETLAGLRSSLIALVDKWESVPEETLDEITQPSRQTKKSGLW